MHATKPMTAPYTLTNALLAAWAHEDGLSPDLRDASFWARHAVQDAVTHLRIGDVRGARRHEATALCQGWRMWSVAGVS